jgi:serine protease
MLRARIAFFTLALGAVSLGARPLEQTRSGIIVDFIAPPPIDLGLIRSFQRAPDSPDTALRASIRRSNVALDRAGATGAHYIAGKVIVKFKDGASTTSRASAMSAAKASRSAEPSYANFEVMSIGADQDAEAVAEALAARSDVEYAQAAYRVHAYCASGWAAPDSSGRCVPNDTFYSDQWNLPDIGIERAWNIQPAAASDVIVAVLDTGVAYTNVTMRHHASAFKVDANGDVQPPNAPGGTLYPSLGDLTLQFVAAPQLGPSSRFVSPHDFIWDTNVPVDLDGHGTHVSGTIGQDTNDRIGPAGIAYNVKIMPVKVIDTEWDDIFDSPNFGTDDVVARGIRYAADNGAKVINMSIGRTGPAAPAVEDAVRYAVGKGAFIAIAGGNEFEEGNPAETFAQIASRIQGAVAVAAVDKAHNRAFYSSSGTWIELAAPGGSFRGFSNEGGILQQTLALDLVETFTMPVNRFTAPRFDAVAYYFFTGTSQAVPHVSGVAAMLVQQGYATPAAIESALEKFAIDPQTRNRRNGTRDNDFGYGEIDARATLRGMGVAK